MTYGDWKNGNGNCRLLVTIQRRNAFTQGIERRLRAVGQMQLAQNIADVGAHGALTDHQQLGNLVIGETTGDLFEYVYFSFC